MLFRSETLGGVMTTLIERNTTIPTEKAEVFSTAEDNQTTVEIHVLQGERKMALDNKTIGKFQLTGIPPAQRGTPQVEVTFDIDANGILHVKAKDNTTGKEQKIRIESSSGLSDSEIEKMVKDAEEHASEDKQRRELVEARNQAESLIHTSGKSLKEFGDKVGEGERKAIEDDIAALRQTLEAEDTEAIREKTNALAQSSMKLGEAMYKAEAEASQEGAADAAAGGDAAGGEAADDTVVDADFEEVDDDDKKSKSA